MGWSIGRTWRKIASSDIGRAVRKRIVQEIQGSGSYRIRKRGIYSNALRRTRFARRRFGGRGLYIGGGLYE